MNKLVINLVMITLVAENLGYAANPPKDKDKVIDTPFIAVSTILISSTVFDVETTLKALKIPNTREANPFMRPFVKNRLSLYGIQTAANCGFLYLSYKMKKEGEKLWWLVPIIPATVHTIAGFHNLQIIINYSF